MPRSKKAEPRRMTLADALNLTVNQLKALVALRVRLAIAGAGGQARRAAWA
jgi:hypothetical protein